MLLATSVSKPEPDVLAIVSDATGMSVLDAEAEVADDETSELAVDEEASVLLLTF